MSECAPVLLSEALSQRGALVARQVLLQHIILGQNLLDFLGSRELVADTRALDGRRLLHQLAGLPLALTWVVGRSVASSVVCHGHMEIRTTCEVSE